MGFPTDDVSQAAFEALDGKMDMPDESMSGGLSPEAAEMLAEEDDEMLESSDDEVPYEEGTMVQSNEVDATKSSAWLPSDKLLEGEVLEHDESAYHMLHSVTVEWPCLTFDFIPTSCEETEKMYPMTLYSVAGTQADIATKNRILLMKMSNLNRTYKPEKTGEDSDSDSDDEMNEDPVLNCKSFKHPGGVNRIRACKTDCNLVSTWSDTGNVHIYNVKSSLEEFDFYSSGGAANASTPSVASKHEAEPIFSFGGHASEGFAMDWSPRVRGRLVTGDSTKHIYMYDYNGSDGWHVDKIPFRGHTGSVEDLQWSGTEDNVFASCSSDKTIQIWDARNRTKPGISVQAHDSDVNVISWSRVVSYLLISGGDDGIFKIWDLRNFKENQAAAVYKWHTAPITSVDWHPTEDSVLAVSGEDDQISLWDLSLENDEEALKTMADEELSHIPPQLLFVHQGQNHIKELHWHPQKSGVIMSTAQSGFNVFKTISV